MKAFQPTMIASFPRTFVELATGAVADRGGANVHIVQHGADGAHTGTSAAFTLGRRPAGLVKPWLLARGREAGEAALPGSQFIDGWGHRVGMASSARSPLRDRT